MTFEYPILALDYAPRFVLCHDCAMVSLNPDNDDIGFVSALEMLEGIRSKNITSVELTSLLLNRIDSVDSGDGGLNSILAINDSAMAHAAEFDAADSSRGPLHGLPVVVKDNIQAVGLPGTAGSLALAGRTVTSDAPLVSRLRDAGAVILASSNLSEWANIRSSQSTSGWSAVGGLTANPWKHPHSAGGSSSGSGAATAAGLTPLAVGTETDGSIICPASLNGCVGIKPTLGNVSAHGVVPISASQDVPGPMARSVKDAALLLEVLTGQSGFRDACADSAPIRIGVVRQWLTSDDATNALFENMLSHLEPHGIHLVDIAVDDCPDEAGDDEGTVLFHELVEDLDAYLKSRPGDGVSSLADVIAFNLHNQDSEMKYFHQDYLERAAESGGRNEIYRAARSRNLDWAVNQVLTPALADVDVLISTSYAPAWLSTLGQGDNFSKASWITMAPAVAGWPIGTIPMGLVDGLPVGLGVVSRANDEANLVRAMARCEKAIGLGVLRPTFAR